MSKTLKRKFGVRKIIGESRNLTCSECGHRAGLHHGSDCPNTPKNKELANWTKEQLNPINKELTKRAGGE
ncbi:MAG TPA: hypothetical protein ENH41_03330 [Candidatus Omnitrophica bacterium]|nr:hypothetical protein [Candidatus Omnitrophota bacterium]